MAVLRAQDHLGHYDALADLLDVGQEWVAGAIDLSRRRDKLPFSFHKEVVRERDCFNLINMIMEHKSLGFENALHEAVKIVNTSTRRFVDLERQWLQQNHATDAVVREYIEGLKDIMAAAWHWQISTNRYRSPDSPFPELRELLH